MPPLRTYNLTPSKTVEEALPLLEAYISEETPKLQHLLTQSPTTPYYNLLDSINVAQQLHAIFAEICGKESPYDHP
jgi:hypothetical protein